MKTCKIEVVLFNDSDRATLSELGFKNSAQGMGNCVVSPREDQDQVKIPTKDIKANYTNYILLRTSGNPEEDKIMLVNALNWLYDLELSRP